MRTKEIQTKEKPLMTRDGWHEYNTHTQTPYSIRLATATATTAPPTLTARLRAALTC